MELLENLHIKNITNILREVGERIEGNLICDVYPDNYIINRNLDKIYNLKKIVKNKKKVIEIGINACHSLLIMLLENPDAEYLLFDLNYHKYTEPCLNYIRKNFPNTKITVVFGDSVKTIYDFINNNPDELSTYDFCHIDGGHEYPIFSKDYENTKKLCNKNSIIIFDDYNFLDIKHFIDNKIINNEIIEVDDLDIKKNNLHFIYKYNM
jgi:hypothetical protein